jgi:hypothetical protein
LVHRCPGEHHVAMQDRAATGRPVAILGGGDR